MVTTNFCSNKIREIETGRERKKKGKYIKRKTQTELVLILCTLPPPSDAQRFILELSDCPKNRSFESGVCLIKGNSIEN